VNMQVSGSVIKELRVKRGWTQEHLAHVAGVSPKTIQRVEKTGLCDLETRSALASVLQVDISQLEGSKKIEQKQADEPNAELFLVRLQSGQDIVRVFFGAHGYRFSNEDPRSADDAERIAQFASLVHDYGEFWEDLDPGARVRDTFELGESLRELEDDGFFLFGMPTKEKQTMTVVSGQKKTFEISVANFQIAYANSDRVVVLDPKATAAKSE
jgi:transcriptional regulator with XRE-family HTH domain